VNKSKSRVSWSAEPPGAFSLSLGEGRLCAAALSLSRVVWRWRARATTGKYPSPIVRQEALGILGRLRARHARRAEEQGREEQRSPHHFAVCCPRSLLRHQVEVGRPSREGERMRRFKREVQKLRERGLQSKEVAGIYTQGRGREPIKEAKARARDAPGRRRARTCLPPSCRRRQKPPAPRNLSLSLSLSVSAELAGRVAPEGRDCGW
jgi:hypothetical protein